MSFLTRSAGVLCHVTSLPAPNGVGDLGAGAYSFVDFLRAAGQSYWQILPLGPTSDGSPYVAESSWAGSPWLISLDALRDVGDLDDAHLHDARREASRHVDFGDLARTRPALLRAAATRFFERARGDERAAFDAFCSDNAAWLEDWALFTTAKGRFGGAAWWQWPAALALREPGALARARDEWRDELTVARYAQFRFHTQWRALREHAARAGVRFIGDVPIYCAGDSADVWAARHLFQLDASGKPTAVSGVPPDYFAQDGQLWGTPLYDWDACAAEGFAWWRSRLRAALALCDVVRIDHFRAFESYWSVPAGAATAREGRWVQGPGDAFFAALQADFGSAPLIAEDLGIITPQVRALRDRWFLPGMRVLQFGFGDDGINPHLPPYHVRACVAYTGTHDNNTTVGWFAEATEAERDLFRRYTASGGDFCHYHMMRACFASVADLAVAPIQDVLGHGADARMNTPGLATGNWSYRLLPGEPGEPAATMLRALSRDFGRLPEQEAARMKRDAEEAAAHPAP